jgi:transcriptional regulator with XRE-family HTH domain
MATETFLTNMGQRIAQCRKEKHFTQEQLAEKMGVSLQTISCIELGKKAIRPENLANLCFHLGVSADYILCGKRTEAQMSDTTAKLSELPSKDFCAIQNLIDLLHEKNRTDGAP